MLWLGLKHLTKDTFENPASINPLVHLISRVWLFSYTWASGVIFLNISVGSSTFCTFYSFYPNVSWIISLCHMLLLTCPFADTTHPLSIHLFLFYPSSHAAKKLWNHRFSSQSFFLSEIIHWFFASEDILYDLSNVSLNCF